MAADRDGLRRLLIGSETVTPDNLQLRAIVGVRGNAVTFLANHPDDATVQDVWQWTDDDLTQISEGAGVHTAVVGGDTTVLRSSTLDSVWGHDQGDRRADV